MHLHIKSLHFVEKIKHKIFGCKIRVIKNVLSQAKK